MPTPVGENCNGISGSYINNSGATRIVIVEGETITVNREDGSMLNTGSIANNIGSTYDFTFEFIPTDCTISWSNGDVYVKNDNTENDQVDTVAITGCFNAQGDTETITGCSCDSTCMTCGFNYDPSNSDDCFTC